jgi:hypothetical protein
MQFRAVRDRADAALHAVLIDVHHQVDTKVLGARVTEFDHLAKLPRRIDMKQRKRRLARIERLHRQMQQHRRILADRIQHHDLVALGDGLAHDVNALGLELIEIGVRRGGFGDREVVHD